MAPTKKEGSFVLVEGANEQRTFGGQKDDRGIVKGRKRGQNWKFCSAKRTGKDRGALGGQHGEGNSTSGGNHGGM